MQEIEMETPGQKFCLRWDSYQSSVTSVFDLLRQDEQLVDVTLCCEGQRMRAHRMLLSACSPYFRDIIQENPCQNLVIFLKDTSAADLRAITEFMYKGSVNVTQTQLASFIKTAEMLQIRGLSGDEDKAGDPAAGGPTEAAYTPPPAKRRRSGSGGTASRPEPQSEPVPELGPEPQPEPEPEPVPVKVEKVEEVEVDLTEEDESLELALGCVAQDYAEYQAQDGHTQPEYRARDGPTQPEPVTHVPSAPSPSQGGASVHSSPSQPGCHRCDQCGRSFKNPLSLISHRKVHEGRTRCEVCGKVYSNVSGLRDHLMFVHRLSREEVRNMVPTRPRMMEVPLWSEPRQSAALSGLVPRSEAAPPPSADQQS